MIFFGKRSLKLAVAEYVEHYHTERNHQELGNELIETDETARPAVGAVECHERPGGILKNYQRRAASVLPEEDRLPRHLTPGPCARHEPAQQSTA